MTNSRQIKAPVHLHHICGDPQGVKLRYYFVVKARNGQVRLTGEKYFS